MRSGLKYPRYNKSKKIRCYSSSNNISRYNDSALEIINLHSSNNIDESLFHKALTTISNSDTKPNEGYLESVMIGDDIENNERIDCNADTAEHAYTDSTQSSNENIIVKHQKIEVLRCQRHNSTTQTNVIGDNCEIPVENELKLQNIKRQNSLMNEQLELLQNDLLKLTSENFSMKQVNEQLISKNSENMAYFSNAIETLHEKLHEACNKLANRQFSLSDKEKVIKNLWLSLQSMPKKFNDIILENKSFVLEKIDDKTDTKKGPLLALNNKLLTPYHSMRVICRIKPEPNNCLSTPTDKMVYLPKFRHFNNGIGFQLNKVLPPTSTQRDVFKEVQPILESCFDGCNVCVLTYGQSGSGKTHTMLGKDSDPGLIILSMKELQRLAENQVGFIKYYLSIIEVYNEIVYDLLNTNDSVSNFTGSTKSRVIIQDNGQSVQIKNISEAELTNINDLEFYLNQSQKQRTSSVTLKNSNSSRSHYIVMIRIQSTFPKTHEAVSKGMLMMCDLAGSENSNGLSSKERNESRYINRSITMLTSVFDALYKRLPVIPFRNSKLTHLLKPSLMGDAKCVFIATLCCQKHNLLDTYRTLNVAKKVEMITFSNKNI